MTQINRLRAYANLPSEVPDTLLTAHIEAAERALRGRLMRAEAPAGHEPDWDEAVTVWALASAMPWLNTFALDGAAKVGRLEGAVEFRFLTPADVEARCRTLMARFEALVGALPRAAQEATVAGVDCTLMAI